MDHQVIKLGTAEYVIIPKSDYDRLTGSAKIPEGYVDLKASLTKSIAADLKAAREHAGLTQTQLAEKIGKSQPMVSGAEKGTVAVADRYIKLVFEACGLPEDWGGADS